MPNNEAVVFASHEAGVEALEALGPGEEIHDAGSAMVHVLRGGVLVFLLSAGVIATGAYAEVMRPLCNSAPCSNVITMNRDDEGDDASPLLLAV
jgi:hypothetical protein